jgi:hypothetical protein
MNEELVKAFSEEIQQHITNINNMAMQNTYGKDSDELSIIRSNINVERVKLINAEKKLYRLMNP